MMGVDYELFWTLNPKSLSPFIKAFELKRKMDDEIAWQNGFYVRMAIISSLAKNEEYPSKPVMSKSKVEDKPMTAEEIKARVMARMKVINSQLGKE